MFFYVYRITHNDAGRVKHYIGSRGATILPTADLGSDYFTSSNIVGKLLREHPERCKIKIVRTFQTRIEAYAFERRYQLRVMAQQNPKFFNAIITGERPESGPLSVQHRLHIQAALKGRTTRGYGWKHKPETLTRMRTAAALRSTPEYRAKISKTLMGHIVTPETRQKLSIAARNQYERRMV